MIGPSNTEKLVSLFLALSIQVGLGIALFSAADHGKPRVGGGQREPGTVLVVELLPLSKAGDPSGKDDAGTDLPAHSAADSEAKAVAMPRGDENGAGLAQSAQTPRSTSNGSPATTTPSMSDLPSEEAMVWRARVQAHLSQFRLYPANAAHDGEQGVALVQFTVDRHGNVSQAWVATSSGIAAIDKETIAAILRAQPLPPFPTGWPDTLDVRLPVAFRLS